MMVSENRFISFDYSSADMSHHNMCLGFNYVREIFKSYNISSFKSSSMFDLFGQATEAAKHNKIAGSFWSNNERIV